MSGKDSLIYIRIYTDYLPERCAVAETWAAHAFEHVTGMLRELYKRFLKRQLTKTKCVY